MKVVRLSALRTGHHYHLGNIPDRHVSWKLSRPQGHSPAERNISIKNARANIENRTREIPACSSVPQIIKMCHKINWVRPQYLAACWYMYFEINAL